MQNTNIGEKLRKLRIHRKMTQAELAGDQITRNMLSRIENGVALPSLSTIWYLAERLEVPAGFLLAEGDDDRVWRKMSEMTDIKRIFKRREYRICLSLCQSASEDADDEIYLIMAESALQVALEEMELGHLHACCEFLDQALSVCEKTIYDTHHIKDTAALYFRFLRGLSPTLYLASAVEMDDVFPGAHTPLCRFILAKEALENGEYDRVEAYLNQGDREDPWLIFLRAHRDMSNGFYAPARTALMQLLYSQESANRVLVYCIFGDLEICCRETADFKGAYESSRDKMLLLEKMLER